MARKHFPITPATRLAIYLRDGLACAWCGRTMEGDGVELSLDHIIPQCEGGSHEASNLITACRKCNCSRGHRSVEEFAAAVGHYLDVPAGLILAYINGRLALDITPFRVEATAIRERRNAAINTEDEE